MSLFILCQQCPPCMYFLLHVIFNVVYAELVDKCIGSRIHIIMKSDREIVGTLLGFDDFVSILYQSPPPSPLMMSLLYIGKLLLYGQVLVSTPSYTVGR